MFFFLDRSPFTREKIKALVELPSISSLPRFVPKVHRCNEKALFPNWEKRQHIHSRRVLKLYINPCACVVPPPTNTRMGRLFQAAHSCESNELK